MARMKPVRLTKYYYLKFIRLKGDPQSLAVGAAIGVFVSLTPTLPLQTVLILVLTAITGTSFISGITVSFLASNPLTFFPIYYFSVIIGNAVTPYTLNWGKIKAVLDIIHSHPGLSGLGTTLPALFHLGLHAIIVMIVGGCIQALPFAVLTYYLSLSLFNRLRKKRRTRLHPSPPL